MLLPTSTTLKESQEAELQNNQTIYNPMFKNFCPLGRSFFMLHGSEGEFTDVLYT